MKKKKAQLGVEHIELVLQVSYRRDIIACLDMAL